MHYRSIVSKAAAASAAVVVVNSCQLRLVTPNTQRRRDSVVELSRVGGVNAPIGSRDPVYKIYCAVEQSRLVSSDDIMTSLLKKLLSIKIHVVKRLWCLFGQFPNCRPNLSAVVVSCELCSHRRRDATRQLSRVGVGVGGMYWALYGTELMLRVWKMRSE